MSDLVWNETHTINSHHKYCYCGRDRNLLEIAIQCRGKCPLLLYSQRDLVTN